MSFAEPLTWRRTAAALLTLLGALAIASLTMTPAGAQDRCSAAGESRDSDVNARADCDEDPDAPDAEGGERAERVHQTVECTAELRNDPSAWFVAYDPDWEDVDVHQETGLLLSDREEGQVVARYRDCDGNDRGSPFWADPPEDGEEADFDGLLQARDRVCEGPGIPWTQAAWDDYRSASSSTRGHGNPACTFVFADASGDQPYPTTVTVSWAAGWSIDGGARMELPPVELITEVPVVVGERRAVRTG